MLYAFASFVCFHVVGVCTYVRQVLGCSHVARQLQQRVEIKRFSWRLAPIVRYSDMCLWQCAIKTHIHQPVITQLTPVDCNKYMYKKSTHLSLLILFAATAEAGTPVSAVTLGGSGRHHHQAEWCQPVFIIGFSVGTLPFPLNRIALIYEGGLGGCM